MSCNHRKSAYDVPTLIVVLAFIATIVGIVESHREEIEANGIHHSH